MLDLLRAPVPIPIPLCFIGSPMFATEAAVATACLRHFLHGFMDSPRFSKLRLPALDGR